MLDFNETTANLYNRGITFDIQEYIFCENLALGENEAIAYALAYEPKEYAAILGTEEEGPFLKDKEKEAKQLQQQQNIISLRQEVEELYHIDVQNKALNLEDYRFTGGQIAQILQNLLHNRVADLDSASTKDVISLIKMLTDQFGLDGGSDFQKHFIQIYPKYNALCPNCNHEFDCYAGLSAKCPHCGQLYQWIEDENRFYPQPAKL